MARNGSGTMSVLNTMVAGNTITASEHNENYSDFADEITNSLALDGQSTMTGAIKGANGSASAPSYTFGSDTNTGIYRSAADTIGFAAGGSEVATVGTTGFSGLGATPIGGVIDYAGASAPTGWLLCYGQAVSRTTYASLFSAISTTYGSGDGSTTFNIPDCRGRVTAAKDDMGGSPANRITNANSGITGTTLGAAGGAETLSAHTHAFSATTDSGGAHTHTVSGTAASDGAHTHTGTTGGHSDDHTHMGLADPSTAFNTDISSGLNNVWSGLAAQEATGGTSNDHTHSFTTDSGGAHTHTVTGTAESDGAHTHGVSGTTDSTGTGTHGNVQPTIIFNKIIFAGV